MSERNGTSEEGSVKSRLAKAAVKLFVSRGYAATSVREIVEEAGVTKPVLYYHFQSKEGIYLHVMEAAFRQMAGIVETDVARGESPRARLRRLADDLFALFETHVDEARLWYAIYYGPPQGAPFFDFDSNHKKVVDGVRRLLEEGIAAGEFAPGNLDDLTWIYIGVFNMALELRLIGEHPELGDADYKRMLELVMDGFARGVGSRR
ncbi:MAG: TetR/AcrR family transcriptional regulator [Candidatus Polarisedimenticolia bacterium]